VRPVRFTQQARDDLLEIWLYVAGRNSEAIADRIFDHVEQAFARLAAHPRLGRARPEIHEDARSLVIERWLALYRVTDDTVEIVRVVDGARDLRNIEFDPE
jgi:toxin ParE1/3/4